jgi:hypothetical protein
LKPSIFTNKATLWLSIGILATTLLFSLFSCVNPTPTTLTTTAQSSITPTITNWLADGIISPDEYSSRVTYENGNFEINWKVDAQKIYIGIRANTTGWVAIGLLPIAQLKNVDYIFGWVSNGKAYIADEYSADFHGLHQLDTSFGGTEDVSNFGGQENNGNTVIEFKHAFVTGDTYDISLTPGNLSIIWSYSSSDDISIGHIHRGYGQIQI